MWRRIENKLWRKFSGARAAYFARRAVHAYAPFEPGVYRALLQRLARDPGVQVQPFAAARTSARARNVFLRHDIDTRQCVDNARGLLDIDREMGFAAGVYFRADDRTYALAGCGDLVARCRAQGFEVGLHSACYVEDDYLAAFARETEQFAAVAGFRPRSFTIHGMGAQHQENRARFCRDIAARLPEFGYAFADSPGAGRDYHHVIEDCHWDAARQTRLIYDDFVGLPPFLRPLDNCLLLTHPCYWQP